MASVESDNEQADAGTPEAEQAADSERRRELIRRIMDYSATHGVSAMSLRPLATAVGSSPRMLLYFFGSKEGMIREILARARATQFDLVEQALTAPDGEDVRPIENLWEWLADAAHAEIEKLFFEGYARSLHDRGGAWQDFGLASVEEWLPAMQRLVSLTPGAARAPHAATLLLATVRGLLLDLLATGDKERVQGAFEDLMRLLNDGAE